MEAYTLFIKASKQLPNLGDLEPETLMQLLKIDSKSCEKVLACQTVLEHHSIFEEFHVFQKAVLIFNDRLVDFTTHQEITVPEIAWALRTIRFIDPIHPFSNEILTYIAVVLHEEGFIEAPDIIKKEESVDRVGVQFYLDQINSNEPVNSEGSDIQRIYHLITEEYVRVREEKLHEEIK